MSESLLPLQNHTMLTDKVCAGAGKSSLVSALLRLSEISGGAIIIDGKDIRAVTLKNLRRGVGMVHQTPFLFEVRILSYLALYYLILHTLIISYIVYSCLTLSYPTVCPIRWLCKCCFWMNESHLTSNPEWLISTCKRKQYRLGY